MFKPVGSLLRNSSVSPKSSPAIAAMRVRRAAKDVIDVEMAGFGEEILKKIKVTTFKNGVLTIISPPTVSAELHMRSEGLIREINKGSGYFVKTLRFRAL